MKKQISFRMVAYTDAAGKYTEDACRNGNEDNFYVDDNLGDNTPNHCQPDKVTLLSEYGMLMAVADGMGGMNAGEVASQIAMDTVKEYFAPGKITVEMATAHDSRKTYLEKVIVEADRRIKFDAKQNPEHEGMGSTIILAWMMGDELTVSWCGDSRAYRFNPLNGIELLSEDHSYVQDLVRKGILTYEQTFEHPQGNIITRSLGDPGKKAQPETRLFNVYQDDIILLCSDGLSGVLRDKKTFDENGCLLPGENIEDIIRGNRSSMKVCREALWAAAERSDWYDNVTAILCEVVQGEPTPQKEIIPVVDSKTYPGTVSRNFWQKTISVRTLVGILGCFFAIAIVGFFFFEPSQPMSYNDTIDSVKNAVCDSLNNLWEENTPKTQDSMNLKPDSTEKTIIKASEKSGNATGSSPQNENNDGGTDLNVAAPRAGATLVKKGAQAKKEGEYFIYEVKNHDQTIYRFAIEHASGVEDTARIMEDSGLKRSTDLKIGGIIKIHESIHK